MATILVAFWGMTLVNIFGMKSSARFSSFCSISGLLLPMSLIIGLGTVWWFSGKPLQINFTPSDILPNFNDSHIWVALTGIMMSFCGIEIATVHARDVKNPQRAFPRALFFSTIIIVVTLIFGALAIAIIVPGNKISLVAGNMQAFEMFLDAYHISWMLPLVALALVIGGLGSVSNWIIAPTKGLIIAAQDGNLPKNLQRENRHGAPLTILIYQAIIVSLLSLVFLLMPSVNGSYWLLTALASQLYMIMYILMFATAIYLRYKLPDHERPFRVPGGKIGIWLVCGVGIIAAMVTITVGFFPPQGIDVGGMLHYEFLLILGLVLMCAPPFITYRFRREHWIGRIDDEDVGAEGA